MKRIKQLTILMALMILTSCSYFLTDHKNDYLKEKQTKSIVLPDDQASRPIVDYFPINMSCWCQTRMKKRLLWGDMLIKVPHCVN